MNKAHVILPLSPIDRRVNNQVSIGDSMMKIMPLLADKEALGAIKRRIIEQSRRNQAPDY